MSGDSYWNPVWGEPWRTCGCRAARSAEEAQCLTLTDSCTPTPACWHPRGPQTSDPVAPWSYVRSHIRARVSAPNSAATRWLIIYRFHCRHTDCGTLSGSSHSAWWSRTPGGLPQTGAFVPTLWTLAAARSAPFPKTPGEDYQGCTKTLVCGRRAPCGQSLVGHPGAGRRWDMTWIKAGCI